MSLSGNLQWDVRTTGSDSNGGAFDPVSGVPGTDYSQQDSAQVAFTDLVIGSTTTQLTSAAHPFTAAHVGNVINIISGTGFTAGRYQVMSVSGATATMDRAVGTAASTGGTGNLGGALANVSTAVAATQTTGNTIWLKAGTYTYTATTSWTSSFHPNVFSVIGYQTTHGDYGTPPLITTATNSVNLVGVSATNTWVYITNINFSNTATTRGVGLFSGSGTNYPSFVVTLCKFSGFTNAIGATNNFGGLVLVGCEITGSSLVAVQLGVSAASLIVLGSNIHDNANVGIAGVTNTTRLFLSRSLVVKNGSHGISVSPAQFFSMDSCTIAGNGGDGIHALGAASLFTLSNCIVYGNTGWGVNMGTAGSIAVLRNNAYGANGSGNLNFLTAGSTAITLTADPFTNDSSGDYSLNAVAGGGAACKGAGYPGIFPGGLTTGVLDIGAAQSGSSGDSNFGYVG